MCIFVYILLNNFAYLSMSIERLHTSYEYLLCLNSSHSGVMLCYLLQILFSSLFITYRWQILLNKQKMHPIRSVFNYFFSHVYSGKLSHAIWQQSSRARVACFPPFIFSSFSISSRHSIHTSPEKPEKYRFVFILYIYRSCSVKT